MIKNIIAKLSACRTIGDVASVYSTLLDYELTPRDLAVMYYIKSWVDYFPINHLFSIDKFISSDLSAILYKNIPVILFGSNDWAEKRYLPKERLRLNIRKWHDHILSAFESIGKPILLVVVPEKDTIIRNIDCEDSARLGFCEEVIIESLSTISGSVHDWLFIHNAQHPDMPFIDNYKYYDSHLLSQDYLKIYNAAINKLFGVNHLVPHDVVYEEGILWGDLDVKLNSSKQIDDFKYPLITERSAFQLTGTNTFADPLHNTWQSFSCNEAPIRGRLAIFGDSHSSIYAQKKLTYLFANTFEFCDFYWDPFCSSGEFSRAVNADYVIFEISERFMF